MTTTVSRLSPKPPEPTPDNPYVQLDWVWEQVTRRCWNKATKDGQYACLRAYKRFLARENGYDERLREDPRFMLSVHWDHFVLYNAVMYWRAQGYASYTVRSYLKGLRAVVRYAASEGLTSVKEFLEPDGFSCRRETNIREAYEDAELEVIRQVISEATQYAMRVVAGYKSTGVGKDPRARPGHNNKRSGEGWAWWDNMVWYFENVLNCRPFLHVEENRRKHSHFCLAAYRCHGEVGAVWRRLGVTPAVSISLIFPLAMKLAMETGLNPYALLGLKRDCYRDVHPLTNLPYIRYYKERSKGEKDLHVALFDDPNRADFHLFPKQSEIIRRTIELILELTEPLVGMASGEDRNRLFLVQNFVHGPKHSRHEGVFPLSQRNLGGAAERVRRELTKAGCDNVPRYLNLGRFRPTVITEMVREGHDFFRVQAMAGHASARTTWRYLSGLKLAPQAQREVTATLVQIHRNTAEIERAPKPYATAATQHQEGVIYKGVLCDCKNVYDPPKEVTRLPTYREGQTCTYWNMCLLCPNVLITRKHLPLLAAYAKEIEVSIAGNNLNHVPNAPHYQKVAAVLEVIFKEFGEEDVAWAEQVAECADDFVDGVTYRGVQE